LEQTAESVVRDGFSLQAGLDSDHPSMLTTSPVFSTSF
jgi:hypothetical protein